MALSSLTLALDWTPNINHIGFFVAKEKGWYAEQGIDLPIISPADDDYTLTPAKKVELGQADFALCPTESVISYRTKAQPFQMIAVGSIFQEDVSAIVVRAHSDIMQPKDLDGRIYASYKARYEDEIVRQMIRNDGGDGNLIVHYPAKLGIWDTILNQACDATWIFRNWEGVLAEAQGESLRYFQMKDYQVPYSYSPVIAMNETRISGRESLIKAFLEATRQGYEHCHVAPEACVQILQPFIPEHDQQIDLHKALTASLPYFGQGDGWGKMEDKEIATFLNWLRERGLETAPLTVSDIRTEALLS